VTLKIKLGHARGTRRSRTQAGEREPLYPLLTRSRTLGAATSDGNVIREVAVALWDAAKIDEPVRLLGVSVRNLEHAARQLDLFADRKSTDRLGPALDAITRRFGRDAIRRAGGAVRVSAAAGGGVEPPDKSVESPEKATASDRRKHGESTRNEPVESDKSHAGARTPRRGSGERHD